MAMLSVSVIIPTFNERENMPLLLPRIHAALKNREHEILVVDDRSPDGTGKAVEEIAKSIPGLRLVTKDKREGIGAALRAGYGLGRFDVLVSTDADLSFDPADIPRLLERIDAGCDLVVGCRHASGGAYAANSLAVRFKQCVSVAGNFVVRRVTGLGLRDYSANFRAIRRDVWRNIQTRDNTNSLLFEMILKVKVLGLKVEEVPVSFVDRIHGRSKLNLWVEAPKFLWKLAYYTLRYRVFAATLLACLAAPGFCAAHDPLPAETAVMKTASGELRWTEGAPEVLVFDAAGKLVGKLPLAKRGSRPGPDTRLRALLPARGSRFLVVEERRRDLGLHLNERRAREKPKAVIVGSVLRLVGEDGAALWEHKTSDKTLVGDSASPQNLRIAPSGTVALLLQDVDPYTKDRPILSVIDPRGKEVLRLDYAAWTKVYGFALSDDGRYLAVHGFGMIPDEAEVGGALGFYQMPKALWIKPVRSRDGRSLLSRVDADGWACCVDTPEGYAAFSHAGQRRILSSDDIWKRFEVRP